MGGCGPGFPECSVTSEVGNCKKPTVLDFIQTVPYPVENLHFPCKAIRLKSKTNDNENVQCIDGPPENYQRTKIQPAAGDGRAVLKLYYQRTKIQPAAGESGSSIKVVLPEDG